MWWQRLIETYHNLFNVKFAIISAIFNSAIVVAVNWSYGPAEFLMAGLAQAISSFLSTGVTARIVQHFSPIKSVFVSYFFGSLIPATLTFFMSFVIHWWNNTPELLISCILPTAISYTTSYITNFITRSGYMLPSNYRKVKN